MLALASAAPRGPSPRSARLFLLLSFDRKNVFARKKARRCGNVGGSKKLPYLAFWSHCCVMDGAARRLFRAGISSGT